MGGIYMLEKRIKIAIIALIIMIFVIGIGGTVLYFMTDLLKSDELLFKKYIAQNVKNIYDVFDISSEAEDFDVLRKNDYIESSNITLRYLEKSNDQEEKYSIVEEGIVNNSDQESHREIKAKYGNEDLMYLELLRKQDTYGFRLSNLVQQFVSVKNASVAYLVSTMGYKGEYFTEKLNLDDIEISDLLTFTDEEIEILTNKYLTNEIFVNIDKSNYTSKRNAVITLANTNSVTTNAYTLTVNKNELNNIYKKILNQAINDEIILEKLSRIDSRIKEAGFNEPEGKSLKERYIALLQQESDKIKYEGADNREITITVYQSKGVTVRTSIKTDTVEYVIDSDNTQGKALYLKRIQFTDEGTDTKTYLLRKKIENDKEAREIGYYDASKKLVVSIEKLNNGNEITINENVDYKSDEISNFNIEGKTEIEIGEKRIIQTDFEENKNILLNNYEDGEKIKSILRNLKLRTIRSLENSQSKINTKLVNNILLWIDEREQKIAQEQQNNEELEKERFNNQFVLYEGKDLKFEHVQKLLKVVAKNMSDYQVINNNKLRIFIEKGKENEPRAQQIESVVTKDYTYEVTINYAEDGYIQSIDISNYIKE